jgi:type II secretory pathway component PulF
MPLFTYTAVNQDGALVKGITEAVNRDQAADNITYNGLYVIDITGSDSKFDALRKKLLYRRIKRKDIIEFVNNIALMLKAGVPLLTVLADIAQSAEEKRFREILNSIKRTIEQGTSFSDALEEYHIVFPDILIRLAAVGEETGSLDKSLQDVADHLQRIEDLVAAVKRALIYPAFALFTTFGALIFWFVYVLPQIMEAFTSMGLTLPLATRVLLAISNFTQTYWYLCIGIPCALFIAFKLLLKSGKIKYYSDLAAINMPIMKLLTHNKLLALFSEQLRILVVSGITIDRALEITADIIGNEVFKAALTEARNDVTAGNRISDALKKHSIFPHIIIRMIEVGETSGSLDMQLAYLSSYYLKRVDDVAEKLSKMIEPIIIVVIGLIFLFIIVSLLFPVYDLVSQIGV